MQVQVWGSHMKKLVIVTAIAALGFGTAANAADLGIVHTAAPAAYIAPAAFNWTGFYIGLNGGAGAAQSSVLGIDLFDANGGFGGLQAGYNHDLGGVVFGVEADVQLSGIKNDDALPGVIPPVTGQIDSFGTVRARVGLPVDRFMPYITGGLAWANARLENPLVKETDTYMGWTIGGGVEVAVTDNITIKGEYLYIDYGGAKFSGPFDFDLTSHVARVGLNYKF